jgi:hypothetical protein
MALKHISYSLAAVLVELERKSRAGGIHGPGKPTVTEGGDGTNDSGSCKRIEVAPLADGPTGLNSMHGTNDEGLVK